MTRIAVTFLLTAVAAAHLGAQSLAERLDRRLDAPDMSRLFWGVAVSDLEGHLLYQRNAERLFVPASNTKLVASIVANTLLGPDFTVNTSVYATGPVSNGVLAGDLVLYGRGDPTFSKHCYAADTTRAGVCDRDAFERLHALALQLRARGVRVVAGDLVGDGSYFEPELIHPAWQNYDLGWWYAAPVSGLGFNDNSVDFLEAPGDSVSATARLEMSPDLGEFVLDNRSETGPRTGRRTLDIFRMDDGHRYLATGTIASGARPRTESAAVLDPNLYAATAFRHELTLAGIVVRGSTRSTVDSFAFAAARASAPLAEVRSRPLRDWLYPILSSSQNWFAEMTLKQLGKRLGSAGSWEQGRRVERRFLIDSVGIDSTAFSLQDGSGLAVSNYVTPAAFTRLLIFARKHANFSAIVAALPQSGKPGTLKDRFAGTLAANAVRAKTGSISGVNALSGYVDRADGTVLVFSVIANHHTLPSAQILAAIDSLVVEMVKR